VSFQEPSTYKQVSDAVEWADVQAVQGSDVRPGFIVTKEPVPVVWEDPKVKRTFKDWIKERFGYGNSSQRDS
jgi:hypothetical protein